MAVRIGYLLPTRESVMEGRHAAAPLLKLAETAEDLGYDSVWVGDSLLARPRHEPLTLLAGVAGRTTNIALGTAILLPALRNPVVMAHQISTLDQVSDGRTIIGVGIATDQENIRNEFMAAGVPFEKRVGRMLEGLRLCRALWSGEAVDWDGRWTVKQGILGPMPVQENGPPIWIGGGAEAMIRRGYAYLNKKLDEKIIPELINQFLEYYESNCTKKTKLYPNILEILKGLKEKEIKICICTNKRQYLAEKIIKELQIDNFFDVVVGSQKSIQLKPSTEMLEIFLKKLLLKPKDVIFIGDSTKDIIPANILGMTSVFVKYGYGKIKESNKADFQISNAKELENFF